MDQLTSASSILARLRAETRASHSRLEAAVGIERRITDAAAYRELLGRFLGFYEPLEMRLEALDGWEDYGVVLSERRKTPWLTVDLRSLGSSNSEMLALPRCSELPRVDTLARGFGCAYVLEGSTLGGRHISHLMLSSAVPAAARRFFASYGEEVGERWKQFIAALESVGKIADQEEIVGAACETFDCMHAWLTRQGDAV